MKFSHLLLFAAGLPWLACAQADQATPAAADPNAPVAPLQYRSVFAEYLAAQAPARSPDKTWVAANRAVMDADGEAVAAIAPAAAPAATAKAPEAQATPHQHEHQGAHR